MRDPGPDWRTLAVDFVDKTAIVVHAPCEPADADWQRCMAVTWERANRGELKALLVFISGARPTPMQRASINDFLKKTGCRAGVITDSAISRGAVTALSWLGAPVQAASPQDYSAIAPFVFLSPEQLDEARSVAADLEAALRRNAPQLWPAG